MTGRLVDDGPEVGGERLPLELCNFSTPECPHYACPDGWHAGEAPNCSCTPDCALTEELIVMGELVPPDGKPADAPPDPTDFWPVDHAEGE